MLFLSLKGVDGLMQNQQKFSSLLVQESDIEEIVISTSGSKSLQEAFCKHEDLLLSMFVFLVILFLCTRVFVEKAFQFQLNYYAMKILTNRGREP